MLIRTPIDEATINKLKIYDKLEISGTIFTGRDAALPRLVKLIESGRLEELGIDLRGSIVFHTAVSPAGIGPTSSNKHDIERLIHSVETHKMRCLKGEISAKRLYTDVDSALRLFRMKHPKFDLQRDPIMVAYYS